MLVVDDRTRRQPHLVAQHVQPPAELDVLVVGERTLVPPADLGEHGTIDQHGAAARKQQRLFLRGEAIDRRAVIELKPLPWKFTAPSTKSTVVPDQSRM